jgi:outer membrane lipoprotein-sorting protein
MQRADVKNASHRKLPDEKLDGSDVYVLESTPNKEAKAPYAKVVTWVRKKDFIPLRTRFYGKDGQLVKTLYTQKVRDYDGRPVVVESLMKSENGHSTRLVVESLQKRADLPDSTFTPNALTRP